MGKTGRNAKHKSHRPFRHGQGTGRRTPVDNLGDFRPIVVIQRDDIRLATDTGLEATLGATSPIEHVTERTSQPDVYVKAGKLDTPYDGNVQIASEHLLDKPVTVTISGLPLNNGGLPRTPNYGAQ